MMSDRQYTNKKPKYRLLNLGEVKAQGWMREQMHLDLHQGIAGGFDKISANVEGNLFASQMRKPGEMVVNDQGISEKSWWAGEHQGYWVDGVLRMAILTNDKPFIERVEKWIESILDTAQKTKYIGIYDEDGKFPGRGFDGELWVQSRVFQVMLGWYEYTHDERILKAVESTVHQTLDHYRKTTYFGREESDGGVAHGVGYMDTLEALHRITGDSYYIEAMIWLYDDFSKHHSICADLQLDKMLDDELLWFDHTPHAAEALHIPGIISFFSDDEKYAKAAKNVFKKLRWHTNPGGGFIAGDVEAIGGSYGAGNEASEYCSQTESIQTLNRLMAYSGNLFCGEWSEVAAMNAAQSARFQSANTAVAYLSRDNCLHANDPQVHGGREMFSANHTAACCTLNSIRLLPYYMEGMWYKSGEDDKILANMYGPSELHTTLNGQPITIIEETNYPFSDKIIFRIKLEKSISFDFLLRVPPNSNEPKVLAHHSEISQQEGLITIRKEWQDGDILSVDFSFQVTRQTQYDGKEAYYQWGILVFGLPFPIQKEKMKEIKESGFYQYSLTAQSEEGWDYLIDHDADFKLISVADGDELHPWEKPGIALKGTLLTPEGNPKDILLFPIGTSPLKRTTFPFHMADKTANSQSKVKFFDQTNDPMRLF